MNDGTGVNTAAFLIASVATAAAAGIWITINKFPTSSLNEPLGVRGRNAAVTQENKFLRPALSHISICRHQKNLTDDHKLASLKTRGYRLPLSVSAQMTSEMGPPDAVHSQWLRNGMPYVRLGSSGIEVSAVCIGAGTFGGQTDETEAHAMLDMAFDEFGVNFIDTSELNPLPYDADTFGRTDAILASWLSGRDRSAVVLATKVAGFNESIDWLDGRQGGGTRLTRDQIIASVESSLERLGTDYIDLLQLQWPDRYVPQGGNEVFDVANVRPESASFVEQLEAVAELMLSGKVRAFGLCDETPYGLYQFLVAAGSSGGRLPKPVTVQNVYNLVDRGGVDEGLVEMMHYEGISFLAHTPLAGGALTGKYDFSIDEDDEDGLPRQQNEADLGRLLRFPGYQAKYRSPSVLTAIDSYMQLAADSGLTQAQHALAFVYSRPYVSSTVVGASSMTQLRENLLALNCPMDDEMVDAITTVHASGPYVARDRAKV